MKCSSRFCWRDPIDTGFTHYPSPPGPSSEELIASLVAGLKATAGTLDGLARQLTADGWQGMPRPSTAEKLGS
jgi:hypothetical protein